MNAQLPMPATDPLLPEDRARANIYAVIGRLFYAAPDSALLTQICHIGDTAAGADPPRELEVAWQKLQCVCAGAFPAAIKLEYDTLFVGVGKAQVTPYTSHYITHSAPDRHLVALRGLLERWGLARDIEVFEVEDHIAGLCDVMRFLIEQQMPVADQRLFFERFAYPGVFPLGNAVMAAASAAFYKPVIAFVHAFFSLEKAAFEMDDSTTTSH